MHASLTRNTASNHQKLEELKSAPSVEAERASLKKQILEFTKKRANIAEQYAVSGFLIL